MGNLYVLGVDAGAPLTEDQRKHLDFIQAVIARLSTSSSTVKGWSLTVAVAAYGFSTNKAEPAIAMLGLVAVIFFGALDAHYLRAERSFRCLYNDARRGDVEAYSMDVSSYDSSLPLTKVIRSWSIAGFYAPLFTVGVLAFGWSLFS